MANNVFPLVSANLQLVVFAGTGVSPRRPLPLLPLVHFAPREFCGPRKKPAPFLEAKSLVVLCTIRLPAFIATMILQAREGITV